jgi:nitroreductase
MSTITSNENLLAQLHWRYATKAFDPAKKIAPRDWAALEEALILTPTSYGFQPYRFVVVTDPVMKEKLSANSWNQKQPADCSHFVVFAAKESVSEVDVDHYIARIAEVRGVPVESLGGLKKVFVGDIVVGPRGQFQHEWATRQTYIALGNLMTCAAVLGVDACPMEGLVPTEYDKVLKLNGSGYATVVACALGYRAAGDKYASLAKVRYETKDLIQQI